MCFWTNEPGSIGGVLTDTTVGCIHSNTRQSHASPAALHGTRARTQNLTGEVELEIASPGPAKDLQWADHQSKDTPVVETTPSEAIKTHVLAM